MSRDTLVKRAADAGYRVEFVDFWCANDSHAPSAIPCAGLCDHSRKLIRVATKFSEKHVLAILEHEIEHAEGKERGTDHPDLGLRCGGPIR